MLFIQIKPPALKLREALVLSLILRRFNIGHGTSRRYLQKHTGIDRSRTLPKLLDRLVASGLVEVHDRTKLLYPREPTGDVTEWFVWKKKPGLPWQKRLSHFTAFLRSASSPLSLEQNVVYWKLRDLERQGRTRQTVVGLATRLLGVSRPTVANALRRLKALGLIDYRQDGSRVQFQTALPDEARAWFTMKSGKRTQAASTAATSDTPVTAPDPEAADPLVTELTNAGLDRKRAGELLDWYHDVDLVPSSDWFDRVKAEAKQEHRANGKDRPDHWGPLFYWKVRQVVEKRRPQVEAEAIRWERERADFSTRLQAARDRGCRSINPTDLCCRGMETLPWGAAERQVSSPEKSKLRRLFDPIDVEEKVGELMCAGCGGIIPGLSRWFELYHHGKTYYLLPPDRTVQDDEE